MGFKNSNYSPTNEDYLDECMSLIEKSEKFWSSYYEESLKRNSLTPKRKVKITKTYTETIEYEE